MKVGQKVVCVDTVVWDLGYGPQDKDIVTIREVTNHPRDGRPFLQFKEYPETTYEDPAYDAKYFRPIDYTYGTEVCEAIETEFTKLKEPIPV